MWPSSGEGGVSTSGIDCKANQKATHVVEKQTEARGFSGGGVSRSSRRNRHRTRCEERARNSALTENAPTSSGRTDLSENRHSGGFVIAVLPKAVEKRVPEPTMNSKQNEATTVSASHKGKLESRFREGMYGNGSSPEKKVKTTTNATTRDFERNSSFSRRIGRGGFSSCPPNLTTCPVVKKDNESVPVVKQTDFDVVTRSSERRNSFININRRMGRGRFGPPNLVSMCPEKKDNESVPVVKQTDVDVVTRSSARRGSFSHRGRGGGLSPSPTNIAVCPVKKDNESVPVFVKQNFVTRSSAIRDSFSHRGRGGGLSSSHFPRSRGEKDNESTTSSTQITGVTAVTSSSGRGRGSIRTWCRGRSELRTTTFRTNCPEKKDNGSTVTPRNAEYPARRTASGEVHHVGFGTSSSKRLETNGSTTNEKPVGMAGSSPRRTCSGILPSGFGSVSTGSNMVKLNESTRTSKAISGMTTISTRRESVVARHGPVFGTPEVLKVVEKKDNESKKTLKPTDGTFTRERGEASHNFRQGHIEGFRELTPTRFGQESVKKEIEESTSTMNSKPVVVTRTSSTRDTSFPILPRSRNGFGTSILPKGLEKTTNTNCKQTEVTSTRSARAGLSDSAKDSTGLVDKEGIESTKNTTPVSSQKMHTCATLSAGLPGFRTAVLLSSDVDKGIKQTNASPSSTRKDAELSEQRRGIDDPLRKRVGPIRNDDELLTITNPEHSTTRSFSRRVSFSSRCEGKKEIGTASAAESPGKWDDGYPVKPSAHTEHTHRRNTVDTRVLRNSNLPKSPEKAEANKTTTNSKKIDDKRRGSSRSISPRDRKGRDFSISLPRNTECKKKDNESTIVSKQKDGLTTNNSTGRDMLDSRHGKGKSDVLVPEVVGAGNPNNDTTMNSKQRDISSRRCSSPRKDCTQSSGSGWTGKGFRNSTFAQDLRLRTSIGPFKQTEDGYCSRTTWTPPARRRRRSTAQSRDCENNNGVQVVPQSCDRVESEPTMNTNPEAPITRSSTSPRKTSTEWDEGRIGTPTPTRRCSSPRKDSTRSSGWTGRGFRTAASFVEGSSHEDASLEKNNNYGGIEFGFANAEMDASGDCKENDAKDNCRTSPSFSSPVWNAGGGSPGKENDTVRRGGFGKFGVISPRGLNNFGRGGFWNQSNFGGLNRWGQKSPCSDMEDTRRFRDRETVGSSPMKSCTILTKRSTILTSGVGSGWGGFRSSPFAETPDPEKKAEPAVVDVQVEVKRDLGLGASIVSPPIENTVQELGNSSFSVPRDSGETSGSTFGGLSAPFVNNREPQPRRHVHASEDLLKGVTPKMMKCRCGCAMRTILNNRDRLDAVVDVRLDVLKMEEKRKANALRKDMRPRLAPPLFLNRGGFGPRGSGMRGRGCGWAPPSFHFRGRGRGGYAVPRRSMD